jgi:hypothetical protein
MSSIRTVYFGGNGGDPFAQTPVNEFGLRAGRYVDQIRVGNYVFGGDGGYDMGSISLDGDEYVSKVELRADQVLDFIRLTTNKGRIIGGGGDGGHYYVLDNIRLISIGGRSGIFVDQVSLKYVEDYSPSQLFSENANFAERIA